MPTTLPSGSRKEAVRPHGWSCGIEATSGACRGGPGVGAVEVVNVEAQLDRARLGARGRREQSEVEVLTSRPRVLTVCLLAYAARISQRNADSLAIEPG
jgi:hypothetical protein